MHRIERLGPIARRPNCGAACDAANRDAGPVVSGFPATLLAMAGHDLRQPLQVITSAHEVLATMLCGTREREELERSGRNRATGADVDPARRGFAPAGAAARGAERASAPQAPA